MQCLSESLDVEVLVVMPLGSGLPCARCMNFQISGVYRRFGPAPTTCMVHVCFVAQLSVAGYQFACCTACSRSVSVFNPKP